MDQVRVAGARCSRKGVSRSVGRDGREHRREADPNSWNGEVGATGTAHSFSQQHVRLTHVLALIMFSVIVSKVGVDILVVIGVGICQI